MSSPLIVFKNNEVYVDQDALLIKNAHNKEVLLAHGVSQSVLESKAATDKLEVVLS